MSSPAELLVGVMLAPARVTLGIGRAAMLAFMTRLALSASLRNARLVGLARTVRGVELMAKLISRRPEDFWRARLRTPGGGSASGPPLSQASFKGSPLEMWGAALDALNNLSPPVVLWLSVSEYGSFRVMKNAMKLVPNGLTTLIDQTSPTILDAYYDHYVGRYSRLAASTRGFRRFMLQGVGALGAMVAHPHAAHMESVRTAPSEEWRESVRELMEYAPIVVLDARFVSPAVVDEVVWLLTAEHVHKAIFLGDPQCHAKALTAARELNPDLAIEEAFVVNETWLYNALRHMLSSAMNLPRRGGSETADHVRRRLAIAKKALVAIRNKRLADAEVDQRVWEWDKASAPDGEHAEVSDVSSSVDAALAMIKRHTDQVSVQLNVYVNGWADASIGILDPGGEYLVAECKVDEGLSPARALLCTLLRVELGYLTPLADVRNASDADASASHAAAAQLDLSL